MTIFKKWSERKFAAFDVKMTKKKKFTEQKIAKKLSRRHFPKKIDQEYKWEICAVYNSHIQITIVLD